MRTKHDLAGKQFGKWTVIAEVRNPGDRLRWECQCDCGQKNTIETHKLLSGRTKSCGCNFTGRTLHREYTSWWKMIRRCHHPQTTGYENYGGRGIAVCDRWRASFENFLADMGPRPHKEATIERENNDGNYEPGNCRWATRLEQGRNKRNNIFIEWNGQRKCLTEWAETTGINYGTLRKRLQLGWSVEKTLSTPVSR